MARKSNGLPLKFDRRQKKKWSLNLDTEVIAMIENYPAYHAKESGEAAPSPDEVVEKIVRKTIGSHSGFMQFMAPILEEKRACESAAASSGAPNKG